jgi:quercetin dioxygenase-like cupin family protein
MGKLVEFAAQDVVMRGDGIETVRLTDPPEPGQSFIMGVTSFPPGTGLPRHSHNTVEQVTLLEGRGVVEINGERRPIVPYDTTLVPADEPHRFENAGDTVMRILWVYGATEVTRTFTDTGETVPNHGSPSVT